MSNANRTACAACRQQRRRCNEQCVFSPYFPHYKAREFEAVHKVFGVSNMTKMLGNLDEQGRREAIKSFEWEALMWQIDPVHGPLGAFKQLWTHLQQQQQVIQALEPKFMAMAHDSPPFSNEALAVPNNLNWVPQIANNDGLAPKFSYQEKNLMPYPYVDYPLREPQILTYVPALMQGSSIMQHNQLPSLTRVDRSDTVLSSAKPSQGRDYQFCNESKVNGQMGMQRGGEQGTDGMLDFSGFSF